ncbi:MAG TPA: twin-arginine translocase subunit TatC [Candidatus Acidoferrales bacterium]|jgi:sec-independent protein translocase protein TatC|nr:twin-arginine translocase subunit TatC [Candidatus Acidoferrales bacterium]
MSSTTLPDARVNRAESDEPGGKMSFFQHLAELRKRLIRAAAAIMLGALVGFYAGGRVMEFVAKPMFKALKAARLDDKLIYTNPTGYLNMRITLGIYLGIVLALPYVLYQVWLFIAPGLYRNERKAVFGFVFCSFFLFLTGIAFAYYLMLPRLLTFLVTFQGPNSSFSPLISINEYFDLLLMVLLGVGVIFEMPILIFFLAFFGIVTPRFLWKNFRYAILIITVIAAILAPTPDATTMIVFMAPMILLYLIGIGVAWLVVRKRDKAALPA